MYQLKYMGYQTASHVKCHSSDPPYVFVVCHLKMDNNFTFTLKSLHLLQKIYQLKYMGYQTASQVKYHSSDSP
jgi:hypothetical protein